MTMQPADIAEIARGLTQTQRRAVLWCNADGAPREYGKDAPREVSFWTLSNVLKGDPTREIARTFKLTVRGEGVKRPGAIWPPNTWTLTPLGLAVRDHLLSKDKTDGDR